MNLIYKNDYGAIYSVEGAPNPNCSHQLIVGSIGIYMSLNDLSYLLDIVEACHYPCPCENCQGTFPDKIFLPNGIVMGIWLWVSWERGYNQIFVVDLFCLLIAITSLALVFKLRIKNNTS